MIQKRSSIIVSQCDFVHVLFFYKNRMKNRIFFVPISPSESKENEFHQKVFFSSQLFFDGQWSTDETNR